MLLALHLEGRLGVVETPTMLPLTVVAPVAGHVTRVWPKRVETEGPVPRIDDASTLATWSRSTGQWLCETLASPTHAWPLKRSSLEANEVSMLLLDALRERSRAEVAIVNRNAVRPPERILQNLTALDVATTLPYDNSVTTWRLAQLSQGAAISGLRVLAAVTRATVRARRRRRHRAARRALG